MKNKLLVSLASLTFLLFAGCASNNNQYYWGEYEALIYQTHIQPENASPLVQIEKLQADIQKAQAKGKLIPPGLYAHLGLMYAANGDKDLAITSLKKEKELFPDAAVFIDGLIERSYTSAKE